MFTVWGSNILITWQKNNVKLVLLQLLTGEVQNNSYNSAALLNCLFSMIIFKGIGEN